MAARCERLRGAPDPRGKYLCRVASNECQEARDQIPHSEIVVCVEFSVSCCIPDALPRIDHLLLNLPVQASLDEISIQNGRLLWRPVRLMSRDALLVTEQLQVNFEDCSCQNCGSIFVALVKEFGRLREEVSERVGM